MSKPVRQQFADTMLEVGREDDELVVLVGDISHFALQPFAEACPGRYYNVGICEPTIVSMGAGLAKVGLKPVIHTIAPFLIERSFEQLKLDFGYHQLGGSIVTVGSAFDYSNLGCTHHCTNDFALLKTIEGTQITYPSSPVEFDQLFRQTYRNGQLTSFRCAGTDHGVAFAADEIRLGEGLRVREGRDLTLIATGPQLRSALDAVAPLRSLGWDPEVLYLHTIRPLDEALVQASTARTGRVLVIEEHVRSGGLGDDVLRCVQPLGVEFASLSIPDRFVRDYGSYEEQCDRLGLNVRGVVARVSEVFGLARSNGKVHA